MLMSSSFHLLNVFLNLQLRIWQESAHIYLISIIHKKDCTNLCQRGQTLNNFGAGYFFDCQRLYVLGTCGITVSKSDMCSKPKKYNIAQMASFNNKNKIKKQAIKYFP